MAGRFVERTAQPRRCYTIAIATALCVPLALDLVGPSALAAEPNLTIPGVIVAEPGKQTPLAIQVSSARELPVQTYLKLSGLHPEAKLSSGYMVTTGTWSIPLKSLGGLQISAPVAAAGSAELQVSLVTVDGTILAEARTRLVVAPAWLVTRDLLGAAALETKSASPPNTDPLPTLQTPQIAASVVPVPPASSEPPIADPPAASPPPAPQVALSPAALARAEKLVEDGRRYLELANIAVARQFFTRAAALRHAPAALMMAETYDPFVTTTGPIPGITPDVAAARKWYEQARQLGATEAAAALARLEGRSTP